MHRRMHTLSGALAFTLLLASASIARADAQPAPSKARALYAILYQPGPAWRMERPMEKQDLRPHGLYYSRLLAEGRLHAGGRLGADGGLAVIWAANEAEAQAMLRDDPAIEAGIFVGEVRLWRPRFKSRDPLPAQ